MIQSIILSVMILMSAKMAVDVILMQTVPIQMVGTIVHVTRVIMIFMATGHYVKIWTNVTKVRVDHLATLKML